MATFRKNIIGWNINPDASGNVWPEPYSVRSTNAKFNQLHWIFANSGAAKIILNGSFEVPKNYVGTSKLIIVWTAQVTSNSVVWGLQYRDIAGNNTNSLDQNSYQETVSNTATAPSSTDLRMETSVTLTAGNFGAGDTVEFNFYRDKSSGSDTLVGNVSLENLLFEYTDV